MSDNNKMTIIATKGTFDWAFPPFIIASTGVAMDKEVTIFFTFYGLNLLLKDTVKILTNTLVFYYSMMTALMPLLALMVISA